MGGSPTGPAAPVQYVVIGTGQYAVFAYSVAAGVEARARALSVHQGLLQPLTNISLPVACDAAHAEAGWEPPWPYRSPEQQRAARDHGAACEAGGEARHRGVGRGRAVARGGSAG